MAERKKPVLIIVMGTSGSGKSTLGNSIAEALRVPFIDGDDLHPASNVEKMSKGVPLDDADRLPWLLSIRQRAMDVCARGQAAAADDDDDEERLDKVRVRQLAERYETSKQNDSAELLHAEAGRVEQTIGGHDKEAKAVADANPTAAIRRGEERCYSTDGEIDGHAACVIACSALKRSYRQLLRYGLDDDEAQKEGKRVQRSDDDLDVYHVYVQCSEQELVRRMNERKGHFMKENMLRSQLATLEDPTHEERVLLLADAPVEQLTQQAASYFQHIV